MFREPLCDLFDEPRSGIASKSAVQEEIELAAWVLKTLVTFDPVVAGGCFISWAAEDLAKDIDVYLPRMDGHGPYTDKDLVAATVARISTLLGVFLIEQSLNDPLEKVVSWTSSSYGSGMAVKTERGDHIEGVFMAKVATPRGREVDFDIIITNPGVNTPFSVVDRFDYHHCRIGIGTYGGTLVDSSPGTLYYEDGLLCKNYSCKGPFREEEYVTGKINKKLWGVDGTAEKIDSTLSAFFKAYHLQP